jgi:hypothetical protein
MRIAIVLPKQRLWRWHRELIDRLGVGHAVTVFLDERAPSYAWTLRTWLDTELMLGSRKPLKWWAKDRVELLSVSELNEAEFDRIVDLSEQEEQTRKSLCVRYDGVPDSVALMECLLDRRTPVLSVCEEPSGRLLAHSRLAIDDKSRLSRGLALAFGRCAAMVEQAIEVDAEPVEDGKIAAVDTRTAPAVTSQSLGAHIGRFFLEKVSRRALSRLRRPSHWSIAFRQGPGPFVTLADDAERYYADPFLFAWKGRAFVFVEEFPYATGKGVISVAELRSDGSVQVPAPVLKRPYHLSYPFVLADGDEIYMLPESATANRLELYRATDFPWQWRLDRVLIENLPLADATPLFHQGRWWLFAAGAQRGATDHDELFLFYSDRLSGPWQPHPNNPVKSDCRGARPAGRIVNDNGRLLRPAQDCEERYGAGLVWNEITELTPTRFCEREVAYWSGPRDLSVSGIHSFDRLGALQVIDCDRPIGPGAGSRASARLLPRSGSAIETGSPLREVESAAPLAPGSLVARRPGGDVARTLACGAGAHSAEPIESFRGARP